jgi:hypothetical protein
MAKQQATPNDNGKPLNTNEKKNGEICVFMYI